MNEDQQPQLSLKDLRDNIKEALIKSGALNSVKANLRKEFINKITHKNNSNTSQTKQLSNSLKTRIVLSLIYHFFKSTSLNHTLSVLVAECGYESIGFISEIDLLHSLQLNNQFLSSKSDHSSRRSIFDSINSEPERTDSVLELLVEVASKSQKHCIDSSMQTDLSGPGIREILDNQVKELHLSYLTRRESERLLPNKTIEERMLSYQRECEERLKKEFDSQLNQIRTVEISNMKHEENLQMRLKYETMRKELESSYQQRVILFEEKERQQKNVIQEAERKIGQMEYETRQRIQRELEGIRLSEDNNRRKNELEIQSIKMFESRVKEMKEMIESREREVQRKEKELEIKANEIQQNAYNEAKLSVDLQLESILHEKATLMIERKRFEDERANDASLRLAISEMRQRHREMETELSTKEDEITALKSTLLRLQNSLIAEDKDVSMLLDSCGWIEKKQTLSESPFNPESNVSPLPPSLSIGMSGKMDGVILMIRKNIQLEATVAQLERDLTASLSTMNQEIQRSDSLSSALEETQKELDETIANKAKLIDQITKLEKNLKKLTKYVSNSREKLKEAEKEKVELENLVTEQRMALEKFRQRLSRQNNSQPTERIPPTMTFAEDFKPSSSLSPEYPPQGWASRPPNYYGQINPGFDYYPHFPPRMSLQSGGYPLNQSIESIPPPPMILNNPMSISSQQQLQPPPQQQYPSQVNQTIPSQIQQPPQQIKQQQHKPIQQQATFVEVKKVDEDDEDDDKIVIPRFEIDEKSLNEEREAALQREREKEREKQLRLEEERERREQQEKRDKEERERRDKERRDQEEIAQKQLEEKLKREKEREVAERERQEREDRERRERKEKEDKEREEREEREKKEQERREREEEAARKAKIEKEEREAAEREKREREEAERKRIEAEKEERYRIENAEKIEEERIKKEKEDEIAKQKAEADRRYQEGVERVRARRAQQKLNQQQETSSNPPSTTTTTTTTTTSQQRSYPTFGRQTINSPPRTRNNTQQNNNLDDSRQSSDDEPETQRYDDESSDSVW